MYSRKTLILYCAASISVTVAVGVIFVETVYPSIRGHLQTILLAESWRPRATSTIPLWRSGPVRNGTD